MNAPQQSPTQFILEISFPLMKMKLTYEKAQVVKNMNSFEFKQKLLISQLFQIPD